MSGISRMEVMAPVVTSKPVFKARSGRNDEDLVFEAVLIGVPKAPGVSRLKSVFSEGTTEGGGVSPKIPLSVVSFDVGRSSKALQYSISDKRKKSKRLSVAASLLVLAIMCDPSKLQEGWVFMLVKVKGELSDVVRGMCRESCACIQLHGDGRGIYRQPQCSLYTDPRLAVAWNDGDIGRDDLTVSSALKVVFM